MNYLHSYHAGNFADVFKHSILVALIDSLQKKEAGFCYLDTHAGAGFYDLLSENAQKTKEFNHGIERLLEQKNPPETIQRYLECVKKNNPSEHARVRYYPGSPFIARHFLRKQDRLILSELHPKEHRALEKLFLKDRAVKVLHQDGYQSLKAFLPPIERRGLVLIDPPFEKPSEFNDIINGISDALRRFETGVLAIWYPIKDRPPVDRFHRILKETVQRPMLVAELSLYPETTALHLNGSGVVIINPPYKIEETLKEILPWLAKALGAMNSQQTRVVAL